MRQRYNRYTIKVKIHTIGDRGKEIWLYFSVTTGNKTLIKAERPLLCAGCVNTQPRPVRMVTFNPMPCVKRLKCTVYVKNPFNISLACLYMACGKANFISSHVYYFILFFRWHSSSRLISIVFMVSVMFLILIMLVQFST